MRHLRIDVETPPVDDDMVELTTWSSGTASLAAGRRMSLVGDCGGRVELDSVWIHLGPDARPARIDGFGTYAEAAAGRIVSTRLELAAPDRGTRTRWPLRATDLDLLGHVNNAAYWQAVEERLLRGATLDPRRPLRARLDHRHAIDLVDKVELVEALDERALALAFLVRDTTPAAVAFVEAMS
jgi:acyl-ACP thioesterase